MHAISQRGIREGVIAGRLLIVRLECHAVRFDLRDIRGRWLGARWGDHDESETPAALRDRRMRGAPSFRLDQVADVHIAPRAVEGDADLRQPRAEKRWYSGRQIQAEGIGRLHLFGWNKSHQILIEWRVALHGRDRGEPRRRARAIVANAIAFE